MIQNKAVKTGGKRKGWEKYELPVNLSAEGALH